MRYSAIPLLVTIVLLAAPAAADAAFKSDLTNATITMTGDGNADLMRIQRSGALLVHDRFSSGDPGFASNADWDTVDGGVQTFNASQLGQVVINGGGSSDVVVLGGTGGAASLLVQQFQVDGGGGLDGVLIDSSEDAVSRTATFSSNLNTGTVAVTGNSGTLDLEHSEVDTVLMRFGDSNDVATVNNTESSGAIAIEGTGGNDTANVAASNLGGQVDFDGQTGTTDTLNFNGGATGGTFLVSGDSAGRAGLNRATFDSGVERVNLNAGGQADSIFKSGPRAVTVNAGGGDDLIAVRDSIGDTANCSAGNDYVLTDSLDTLNECEGSDRTQPQPDGGGTMSGTEMTTLMTSMMTVVGDMSDRVAPTAGLSGLKGSIKLKTLLKGLKAKVLADESSSYEVQLLGSTSNVRLSRTYNVTLAKQNLATGAGIRDIKLKPNKRLIGKARKFTVRVVVTPTDAAGNRGKAVTKTLKVKP
jgi:hypothetical protein